MKKILKIEISKFKKNKINTIFISTLQYQILVSTWYLIIKPVILKFACESVKSEKSSISSNGSPQKGLSIRITNKWTCAFWNNINSTRSNFEEMYCAIVYGTGGIALIITFIREPQELNTKIYTKLLKIFFCFFIKKQKNQQNA
jgi:hypothetical protein